MESSLLKQVHTVDRGSLFFNQWEWSVLAALPEAGCVRGRTVASTDSAIENRKRYEHQRFNLGWAKKANVTVFTDLVVNRLHTVARWLETQTEPYKLVTEQGRVTLYSNSFDQIQDFVQTIAPFDLFWMIKQAVLTLPANAIMLKGAPKYQYRTFFRGRELTDHNKTVLKDWINNMAGEVKASPSMRKWLNGTGYRWNYQANQCESYYFVEHNDAKLDVWMSMVSPGLVRKTMQVLQKC